MKVTWSIPVRGERLDSARGDLVRARHLIEALRADGHDVVVVEDAARRTARLTVATYRRFVSPWLPRRLARVLRDLGRWVHAWKHGLHLAAAARKQGAHVIIETHVEFAPSGAVAARRTGIPLLLDDSSPSSEAAVLGAGLPSLGRHVFRAQTRTAKAVVAVCEAMRGELLAEGVPPEKLYRVPNGVDLEAFLCPARAPVRERLGVGEDCVVGFVGSFQVWHRVDLLVEAAARLGRKQPIRLLLVGDGPERGRAMDLARKVGVMERVTDLGDVPPSRVPDLVSAFDIGVLPGSNPYGHPMKLLEYAAARVPPVAPDIAPVREILEHEVTGLLFSPGDPGALAAALSRLAGDEKLRQRLGQAAFERVKTGASWKERARALLTGYATPSHSSRGGG